jgi:hypothetical protein
MMQVDCQIGNSALAQMDYDVFQKGPASQRQHRFGQVIGERPQALPLTCCQDHSFH